MQLGTVVLLVEEVVLDVAETGLALLVTGTGAAIIETKTDDQ